MIVTAICFRILLMMYLIVVPEPDCKLNDAVDCVNSFQEFVELKNLIGKDLSKKEADDFCKYAPIYSVAIKFCSNASSLI